MSNKRKKKEIEEQQPVKKRGRGGGPRANTGGPMPNSGRLKFKDKISNYNKCIDLLNSEALDIIQFYVKGYKNTALTFAEREKCANTLYHTIFPKQIKLHQTARLEVNKLEDLKEKTDEQLMEMLLLKQHSKVLDEQTPDLITDAEYEMIEKDEGDND